MKLYKHASYWVMSGIRQRVWESMTAPYALENQALWDEKDPYPHSLVKEKSSLIVAAVVLPIIDQTYAELREQFN